MQARVAIAPLIDPTTGEPYTELIRPGGGFDGKVMEDGAMTPRDSRVRWRRLAVGLSLGLLLASAGSSALATTIHGLGFDTPVLADLADRSADAAVAELPVSVRTRRSWLQPSV